MKYEEISQRDPQELDKDIDSGNSDLANKAMFDYLVSAKNFHQLLDIYLKHMKNTDIVIARASIICLGYLAQRAPTSMKDSYVQVFKELKRVREEREELAEYINNAFQDIKIFCRIPYKRIKKYIRPIKKNRGK